MPSSSSAIAFPVRRQGRIRTGILAFSPPRGRCWSKRSSYVAASIPRVRSHPSATSRTFVLSSRHALPFAPLHAAFCLLVYLSFPPRARRDNPRHPSIRSRLRFTPSTSREIRLPTAIGAQLNPAPLPVTLPRDHQSAAASLQPNAD